ncbi:hypothetical protein ACJJID_17400 [Microbulbifer sp. CnH-101-G]|uniref:hypothetical protein n=1 Tax=Microbulbifer sp. CnH-101-G TaxID=3243393 RepID=UPI00403913E3
MFFIRLYQASFQKLAAFLMCLMLSWAMDSHSQFYTYHTPAEYLRETKPIMIPGNIFVTGIVPKKNHVPSHLKEFGFYHSGWDEDDIPEVAKFSTFVDVWCFDIDLMEVARRHGLKIWVALAPIFFKDFGKNKQEDYRERWERARHQLLPFKDIIYAFDPLDEPFQRSSLPDKELKLYFEEIGALIKKDFPTAKLAITFTHNTVSQARFQLIVPENFNLFGVDYYYGVDFQNKIVEKLMHKTQHMDAKYYLIPRGFKTTNSGYETLSVTELLLRARQAYNFAVSHSKVEVVFPFHWKGFVEHTETYIGIENIPVLRNEYEKIGRAISRDR